MLTPIIIFNQDVKFILLDDEEEDVEKKEN
jgi:hypothetical protein